MEHYIQRALVFLSIACGAVAPIHPCIADQGTAHPVRFSLVSDEFDLPVSITANPLRPDEVVVVERDGLAKSFSKKDRAVREILDIEDLVNEKNPNGLMSLSYTRTAEGGSGEFFANYIDVQGDLVIARFAENNGKLVDDEQMTVVMKVAQIGPNSHGGQIVTRIDNSLLITTGDGEEQPKEPSHAAQSSRSLLGKILRITPHKAAGYAVPQDNPFAGSSTTLPEVWALGFRSPDYLAVDSTSGEIFVVDNSAGQLEINLVQLGKNYGWDMMEGATCRGGTCGSELGAPVLSISRTSPQARLVGGAVYRGKKLPELNGKFIFSESPSATLLAAEVGPDKKWRYSAIGSIPGKEISAIGLDASGELYVATRDGALFEAQS